MKNIILYDGVNAPSLYPLTFTRPIAELRVGILTIKEKWERRLNASGSFLTQDYLQSKFKSNLTKDNFFIDGRILPDDQIVKEIDTLQKNEGLAVGDTLLAYRSEKEVDIEELKSVKTTDFEVNILNFPEQIFQKNKEELNKDFQLITTGRISQALSHTNQTFGDQIFVEEGASVECSVLNSDTGPIYIGKGATILEGCLIRGSFAMCEKAVLKMGAKIYGPTTLGPNSTVCGEIKNVVFQGNSNKGHAGYLGNSVIGEWCNLGANTNASNMKNNYGEVKLWDYTKDVFRRTGIQFCGLIMGDHSKTGISTMFNTGTVVGVGTNVFGSGYPRTFIPSFSWGGRENNVTNKLSKCVDVATTMMSRKGQELTQVDIDIITHIFEHTSKYRKWE